MNHPPKLLLKKFLEGSCSETELFQVKQLLKQPDADKLLEEILLEQSANKSDLRFVMDTYMIRRIELKRNEAEQCILNTQYIERRSNSPLKNILMHYSRLQDVEEIAIGIICGKFILQCLYLNGNIGVLSA